MGDMATRADCAEVLDALESLHLPEARNADVMLAVLRAFRLIADCRKSTTQPAARPTREA